MKKYNNLNGLRCFAAIGIICMHVYTSMGFKINTGIISNYLFNNLIIQFNNFVQLFFIISGFSMCCGYYDKIKNNKISLDKFYSKRYLKILPFFSLLVLADLIVSLLFEGQVSIDKLYEAFANITLMFGFYTNSGMSVIGVGWTLGVIFGFYILFPFFIYLIWTKKRAWLSLIITLFISYISNIYFESGNALCFPWICYFICGGLIYLYRETINKLLKNPSVGLLISFLGFILVFTINIPTSTNSSLLFLFKTLKKTIGFSLMLIGSLSSDSKIWSNPISNFISKISLEIYLAHMMIFRFIEKIGLTSIWGATLSSYIIACILTILGVIIFSFIYVSFEKRLAKVLTSFSCK